MSETQEHCLICGLWITGDSHKHRRLLGNFSIGVATGKTLGSDKNRPFSSSQRRDRKLLRFLLCFRLNLRVVNASAEGASESVGYFARKQHMTSSFQIPGGGQLSKVAGRLQDK